MEHLFGGALVAVIVVAVALTVWHSLFRRPGGGGGSAATRYQCLDCEHVFEPDEIPRERLLDAPDPSMALLDCPKCKAEYSSMRMVRCPKCGEYYVPQRAKYYIEHGRPAPEDVRDVCPKCGTDRLRYMRQNERD